MIPPFQELMLPILERASSSNDESIANRTFIDELADRFKLSESDRKELLSSGTQSRFENRVYWALVHLRRAGLIESTGRGLNRITQRGKDILATKPSRIDLKLLSQFPEFRQFRGAKTKHGMAEQESSDAVTSPLERLDAAFTELREALVAEVETKLASVDPFRFERVVLDLLVKMGYGGSLKEAAAVTQKTGDEGIDGVINEDRLGLNVIYIQAKRWKGSVGRPEIQTFVGALAGKNASKGVFITTSAFHENARAYAAGLQQKVILIDGRRLADLMIEHGIGVTEERSYPVKKIDSDYFEEG
jgi:restriction system protein